MATNNDLIFLLGFRASKQDSEENRRPCSTHRPSLIYSIAAGSYSGSGIESIAANDVEDPHPTMSSLRRSKTAPSRRDKYGAHEPQQIIHVNRTSSQRK